MGKALMDGTPVVLTAYNRIPEVVCQVGKELEALETLAKMGLITLTRPVIKESE